MPFYRVTIPPEIASKRKGVSDLFPDLKGSLLRSAAFSVICRHWPSLVFVNVLRDGYIMVSPDSPPRLPEWVTCLELKDYR